MASKNPLPSKAVAETLSLIELCRGELSRLRKNAADYRRDAEDCRRRLSPVMLERDASPLAVLESRAFAADVKDPQVKRLLPEIAET